MPLHDPSSGLAMAPAAPLERAGASMNVPAASCAAISDSISSLSEASPAQPSASSAARSRGDRSSADASSGLISVQRSGVTSSPGSAFHVLADDWREMY